MSYVSVPMYCTCCLLEKLPRRGRNPMTLRLNGVVFAGWEAVAAHVKLPRETVRHRAIKGICLRLPSRSPELLNRYRPVEVRPTDSGALAAAFCRLPRVRVV